MIQVENLTKTYGDHIAVDNISFTIKKGRIYGFLGPNGAGKSTTMNVITGYISASAGTVKINGIDITKSPSKAKQFIGYLPEIPPLYPDMTVREFLSFVAELKHVVKSERKEQVQKVMNDTCIDNVSERLIRNLSKGYKQRVGIAQALLGEPEVIILDEPTVGLDPKQIIEIRTLIRELGKKHTVILSSHILSEVSAVCDEIIIISNGQVVAQDTAVNLETSGEKSGQKLIINVCGKKEDVSAAVVKSENIADIAFEDTNEEGVVQIHVSAQPDKDIRREVSEALMKAMLPIVQMNVTRQSLEDVFLELTKDDKNIDSDDEDDEDYEDDVEDSNESESNDSDEEDIKEPEKEEE